MLERKSVNMILTCFHFRPNPILKVAHDRLACLLKTKTKSPTGHTSINASLAPSYTRNSTLLVPSYEMAIATACSLDHLTAGYYGSTSQ